MIKLINIKRKGNFISAFAVPIDHGDAFNIIVDVSTRRIVQCDIEIGHPIVSNPLRVRRKLLELAKMYRNNLPEKETIMWY